MVLSENIDQKSPKFLYAEAAIKRYQIKGEI